MNDHRLLVRFTFHYDSINSAMLLYLLFFLAFVLHFTMILLILTNQMRMHSSFYAFTFHYDSINSGYCSSVSAYSLFFTFHYDSINSCHPTFVQIRHVLFLHFTMILLIPVPKSSPYLCPKTSLFCRPLQNSTCLSSH